jgi:hypothetical protein
MQDNPSTDNQTDDTGSNTPYFEIDREEWEIAFEAFKGTGYTAIRMGMNLRMLYKYLDAQLFKPQPVMEALDLAMEVLYPLTEFHKATFDLFIKYADCELTFQEEQMLRALGVKF